ncbi:hypothetical protein Barb6_01912 [Bacteroidales bacterium Barb6]|nr:hypothetical protein Barb6_01912 [Bacteroidales bacterium Barb6]
MPSIDRSDPYLDNLKRESRERRKAHPKTRNPLISRMYSDKRYRTVREDKLRANPLCERCEAAGRYVRLSTFTIGSNFPKVCRNWRSGGFSWIIETLSPSAANATKQSIGMTLLLLPRKTRTGLSTRTCCISGGEGR